MSLAATPDSTERGDQIYLDKPYLSIRWRGVPRILFGEWKGYATSQEFRDALLTGLRAIRERQVAGYVSDARLAKVFEADDQRWVSEVWLPQAVAAGLKRMAMVTAAEGMGKVTIEEVVHQVDTHGLSMRSFATVETATTWALTGLMEP